MKTFCCSISDDRRRRRCFFITPSNSLFAIAAFGACAQQQKTLTIRTRDTQKESHLPIFIHLGIPAFPLPLLLFDPPAAAADAAPLPPPPPPPAFASISSLSAFALAASLSASAAPGTTPLLRSARSSGRSLGASFIVVVVVVVDDLAAPAPAELELAVAGPQWMLAAGLSPSENRVSLASSAAFSTVFGGAV